MPDDLLLGKAEILERCVARVREEYEGRSENLAADLRRQDSILLNLQRACEAAIGRRRDPSRPTLQEAPRSYPLSRYPTPTKVSIRSDSEPSLRRRRRTWVSTVRLSTSSA